MIDVTIQQIAFAYTFRRLIEDKNDICWLNLIEIKPIKGLFLEKHVEKA